jgi:hypothetical protein
VGVSYFLRSLFQFADPTLDGNVRFLLGFRKLKRKGCVARQSAR